MLLRKYKVEPSESAPTKAEIYGLTQPESLPVEENPFVVICPEEVNPFAAASLVPNVPFDDIKKMKELLVLGAITQAEFDAFKKKTLGI